MRPKVRINLTRNFLFFLQLFWAITVSGQNYKYTSTNLNLRSGPTTTHTIFSKIPEGARVEMAEYCDCAWIRVYYDGTIGYVSSKYLINQREISRNENTRTTNKYYTNSDGDRVQSPTYYNSTPNGATALCGDGTYSFSRNRRGTCSRHGGVAKWL